MTKLDLRTLRLAPGDHRSEQVTATIAPFTAGAQDYHAEPPEVQARLGLTRLPGGLLFDLAFDVAIIGPCQRCLEPAHAGLCPQCGADRNVVECGCEPPKDARWERLRELL